MGNKKPCISSYSSYLEGVNKKLFFEKTRLDAFIEAVNKNPSCLKHLEIAYDFEDNYQYFMKKLLKVLSNNKHLTALSITPSSNIVSDCINLIKTNRKLEYLCMVYNFVKDEEMAEIANNLKHNKTLKTFELKVKVDGRLRDTDETYHALKAAERKWWNPLKIVMPRPRRG